jgi:branched-chain amino acid transport system substrate-binding protein
MNISRRTLLGGIAATSAALPLGAARAAAPILRIGVLTDMSGVYRDVEGPTTVACVKQAVEEFTAGNPDVKVEVLVADHQNKADISSNLVRRWFDESGVDAIVNVGNSAVALAVKPLVEGKDKAALITSAGSSNLTGKSCSPNWVHWAWDSWCLAHSTATSLVKTGGDKWFFVTADYAFGHAAQADATKFVEAAGGKVLGAVRYPYGTTTDFSSFLLQAQSSGANTIAFANSGADLLNCLKQSQEFGLGQNARLAAMVGYITDVLAMGLPVAQGLTLTETFYWDLNDRTRAFMKRIAPKLGSGVFPNMSQAGDYSATLHYLKCAKALGVDKAKASGRAVIEAMKATPTDDDCFGRGEIRADGRKIHPAYLFEVKKPAESKSRGDIYKLVATVPAAEAFRPLAQGGCPLIHT